MLALTKIILKDLTNDKLVNVRTGRDKENTDVGV